MEKRRRQIFSKTEHASQLTRQRTLQINNAHSIVAAVALLTAFARSEKRTFLIHGELTETNKAPRFFPEVVVI